LTKKQANKFGTQGGFCIKIIEDFGNQNKIHISWIV